MTPPAPPQIVGRYGIYGRIASGGMASVHFGRLLGAAGFSRTVAVKRLHPHLAEDPQFLSTMIDEARLAARIHHPNVVPTLDVVSLNGELLVVMEYVRGESLARLLRAEITGKQRLPVPVASAIVIGALHGLHAAHEATSDRGEPLGIVHRDVSPQNILVGVDGVARVIDFGVAKAAGRLQTTSDGAVKGKVAYMAPEQLAAGDKRLAVGEVTRAADIYAMGVVLWEMLAGKRLFVGEHDGQLVLQVLLGAKDPPSRHAPGLPAPLDALVMKAITLDPADRFSSAKEMAEALFRIAQPAFSTDVGTWVEGAAKVALARRGAQLAEIESLSGAIRVPSLASDPGPASGRARAVSRSDVLPRPLSASDELEGAQAPEQRPAPTHALARGELPTVSSQPSSLSLETPSSGVPASIPRRRGKLLAVFAMSALLAAAGFTLARHVGSTRDAVLASLTSITRGAVDAAVAPAVATSVPEAPPPRAVEQAAPIVTTEDMVAPAASAHAAAPSPDPASSVRSPKSHSKPHPPTKPAPFRFAQPD